MTRIPLLLLSVSLGLAACQAAPLPAPVRYAPRPPAKPAPEPSEVEGSWFFRVLGDRCTARVAHRDMVLDLTAGPAKRVGFTVSAPGRGLPASRSVRLHFRSDGGRWQLPGRTDGSRVASASMPLNTTGEGRIRDLLGGGTLRVQGSGVSVPVLALPDAGVSGRDWYGCLARLQEEGAPAAGKAAEPETASAPAE
ncbi:hypothetical protein [Roseomonas marmotae]|uniref:Lipoprotein n=1 Tax=Roseomonas marmotae TaxID=2768161 RepID=A0ABS3KB23_9PROT|nr:hypothetical protein [Roseomonas marmotae]MBO1073848.1 hypothetical protein [Roseomonas marmotae]QTI78523.1 hypothetical protein IAI58_12675 [Roseomonas marmotae]